MVRLEHANLIVRDLDGMIRFLQTAFPEFKVPEGHTVDSYFEKVVREGFAGRVPFLEGLARQGALRTPLAT